MLPPDLALNAAYLTWKYEQNPYLDEPLIYLALENERVVGMRGFYGTQWQIGRSGQIVVLPCTGDTTIAPEHRNRGLLRQLLRFVQDDEALAAFPYMLSFSAGAPRIPGAQYATRGRSRPPGRLGGIQS